MAVDPSKDPNKLHYFEEVKPEELEEALAALKTDCKEFIVWEKGEDEDQADSFKVVGLNLEMKTLSLEFQGSGLFKKSKYINKYIFFRGLNSQDDKFFSSGVLNLNKNGSYSLRQTDKFFLAKRRKNYRIDAGSQFSFYFFHEGIKFIGIDISAGGMSFTVPETMKANFPKGGTLLDGKVKFNEDIFEIPQSEVMRVEEKISPDGKLIISLGIRFITFLVGEEATFAQFIAKQARLMEVKKNILDK